jgi:hypothetical protein
VQRTIKYGNDEYSASTRNFYGNGAALPKLYEIIRDATGDQVDREQRKHRVWALLSKLDRLDDYDISSRSGAQKLDSALRDEWSSTSSESRSSRERAVPEALPREERSYTRSSPTTIQVETPKEQPKTEVEPEPQSPVEVKFHPKVERKFFRESLRQDRERTLDLMAILVHVFHSAYHGKGAVLTEGEAGERTDWAKIEGSGLANFNPTQVIDFYGEKANGQLYERQFPSTIDYGKFAAGLRAATEVLTKGYLDIGGPGVTSRDLSKLVTAIREFDGTKEPMVLPLVIGAHYVYLSIERDKERTGADDLVVRYHDRQRPDIVLPSKTIEGYYATYDSEKGQKKYRVVFQGEQKRTGVQGEQSLRGRQRGAESHRAG